MAAERDDLVGLVESPAPVALLAAAGRHTRSARGVRTRETAMMFLRPRATFHRWPAGSCQRVGPLLAISVLPVKPAASPNNTSPKLRWDAAPNHSPQWHLSCGETTRRIRALGTTHRVAEASSRAEPRLIARVVVPAIRAPAASAPMVAPYTAL
uniref:ID381 n=1 Tax=Bradyrhizobium japonicum TaxID=375 RepID=Q9ANA9_BRAJP|nr:ID381 [Bradyrhizobium japonicum]